MLWREGRAGKLREDEVEEEVWHALMPEQMRMLR